MFNSDELAQIYTDTYSVQKGDTLLKVALQFGVAKADLAHVNKIVNDTIFLNQVSMENLMIIDIESTQQREIK
jgi:LysM repeat protein